MFVFAGFGYDCHNDMSSLVYIERKGGRVLLWMGHQYRKKRDRRNGSSAWRCAKYYKHKCSAYIIIKGYKVLCQKPHSKACLPDFDENIVAQHLAEFRKRARIGSTPLPQLYQECVEGIKACGSERIADKIPTFQNLKHVAYKSRRNQLDETSPLSDQE